MALKLNSSGGGSVTLDAPVTANNYTLTAPTSSGTIATTDGGNTTFTSITDSGNLTFTGTGNRITGDFSGAASSRVAFQTSTTNGATVVSAIPNGTATQTNFILYNSSSPDTNFSALNTFINASETTFRSIQGGTGTYLPMTFYTGGSERMRIDTSGNLLVGSTASPAAGTNTTRNLVISNDIATGSLLIGTNASFLGRQSSDGSTVLNTGQANIIFSGGTYGVNATERMRIDSSGNLLVGTTSASVGGANRKFVVACNADGNAISASATSGGYLYFYNSNGFTGGITHSGTTTTYATSSDYRLKENIQPMQNALARNSQLNPVTYQWKADGSLGEGFIAHELQAVCPNAVTGEKDAVDKDGNPVYQGVDTSFLVGHLVACINELRAELDELKAKVK